MRERESGDLLTIRCDAILRGQLQAAGVALGLPGERPNQSAIVRTLLRRGLATLPRRDRAEPEPV